jgi:hypothetical protein
MKKIDKFKPFLIKKLQALLDGKKVRLTISLGGLLASLQS